MSKLRVSALIVVLAMALAPQAFADTITLTPGGGSVTLSYQTSFAGSNGTATFTLASCGTGCYTLTVVVTNTSTDPLTRVTGLGFNTSPNITVSSSVVSGGMTGWDSTPDRGIQGVGGFEIQAGDAGNCATSSPASHGGLCVGANQIASGTVVFNLTGYNGGPLTIDVSILHFQSLPNGDSEKPEGHDVPDTTVPEPASLVLLGSGLLGAGRFVRRKLVK